MIFFINSIINHKVINYYGIILPQNYTTYTFRGTCNNILHLNADFTLGTVARVSDSQSSVPRYKSCAVVSNLHQVCSPYISLQFTQLYG